MAGAALPESVRARVDSFNELLPGIPASEDVFQELLARLPSSDNEYDHFSIALPGAGHAMLYAFQKPGRERFVHAVLSWDDDPEGQCWSAKHPATSASLP